MIAYNDSILCRCLSVVLGKHVEKIDVPDIYFVNILDDIKLYILGKKNVKNRFHWIRKLDRRIMANFAKVENRAALVNAAMENADSNEEEVMQLPEDERMGVIGILFMDALTQMVINIIAHDMLDNRNIESFKKIY